MKILLAEDDPISRTLALRALESWGHEVVVTQDGPSALKAFKENPDVRLAVLDWMMPEMSGTECLREILKLAPGAKVVIASGYAANGRIDKALEEGARTCLHKPYEARQLLEVVRKLLDEERV